MYVSFVASSHRTTSMAPSNPTPLCWCLTKSPGRLIQHQEGTCGRNSSTHQAIEGVRQLHPSPFSSITSGPQSTFCVSRQVFNTSPRLFAGLGMSKEELALSHGTHQSRALHFKPAALSKANVRQISDEVKHANESRLNHGKIRL